MLKLIVAPHSARRKESIGCARAVYWHSRPWADEKAMMPYVVELGRVCAALDPPFKPIGDEAGPLTEYAWRSRYPGDTAAPERSEAEALEAARMVYEAILSRLPQSR